MRKKLTKNKVFTSFCRLCLAMSENLIDITTEEFDFDIIDLMFETLDIKFMLQNPVYPKQFVCTECLDVVQFIKKFKEGCRKSLETFTKCVIKEVPKDMSEMCWTGDRKRLKDLMSEVNGVHEDSLVVQWEHYKQLFSSNPEVKDEEVEEGETVEMKDEVKEEEIEVKMEGFDYEYVYMDDGETSEKSVHESDVEEEDTEEDDQVQSDKTPKRKRYKKYQCDVCHKYLDGYDIKFHMNTHLKIFPFRCDEEGCDRKFTCPSGVSVHKKKDHKDTAAKSDVKRENLIPCDRCGLAFTRKQLYNHSKRNHGDEEYKCEEPDCGQAFSNLLRLNKHQKRAHALPKQKYTCELCGKAFRKTRLKYHMNIHMNIKPFVCDFEGCTKACPDPGQLAVHKRIIHLKTIKIVCKICGKPFKTKADHDIHITYHGTPSLPCQICGKLLMNRKTLAKHLLIHTGEKKYKCTFEGCTKSFPVSTGLTVHMRSHTKEKDPDPLLLIENVKREEDVDLNQEDMYQENMFQANMFEENSYQENMFQAESNLIFDSPKNLLFYFQNDLKGRIIASKLLNLEVEITHELECAAVNYVMDMLLVETGNNLKFGQKRNEILHIVGQSMVLTFPRLKTEIFPGEDINLEHKRLFYVNPGTKEATGHVLSRFKRLQVVVKRKKTQHLDIQFPQFQ